MDQFIVTEKCSTIRMLAREALKGRWKLAFAAILVYNIVIYVPTLILSWLFGEASLASSIYSMLIAGPLALGYSIFVLALFRNQEPRVAQIFYGFEKFGKSLGLLLLITLFVILYSLLILPVIAIGIFLPFFLPFAVLALIPALIAMIKYSQAFFILADYPDIGVLECIGRSKMLMEGNKTKYFLLYLSFIGWFIAASIPVVIFGVIVAGAEFYNVLLHDDIFIMALLLAVCVGFVFVEVYLFVSLAAFYDMASGNLRPGCIISIAEVIDPAQENEQNKEDIAQENEQDKDDLAQENEQTNQLQRDS